MPWMELSPMEQREEFVGLASAPGANVSGLCRRFGISRTCGYKWLARHRAEGAAGLADRSRRPHVSPKRSAAALEAKVLAVRAGSNNAWGGRKIARVLADRSQTNVDPAGVGLAKIPAFSTITQILRRHGKLEQRAHEHPGPFQRFEREHPNDLWQMDFKGHFATAQGRCHPLTVLDDHSRYSLALEACADEQDATVRARLTQAFRRYGLPDQMLMDNGPPWGDTGGEPFTIFSVWLLRLGVAVSHGRPRHPQTQGKDERFHRTLKAEVLHGAAFEDLLHCQRAFDRWRRIYNCERLHEALKLATPHTRFRPSARPFPETLPPVAYASTDIVRRVDQDGCFSFKGRRWRISKAFRRQAVALRQTEQDGRLDVLYCAQTIAAIDLASSSRPVEMWTSHPRRPQSHRR